MTFTAALVDFAQRPLIPSDRARAIAELSAVDWAACGMAGFDEGTFTGWAREQSARGPFPTFAHEGLTPSTAALVNGTVSHALDFDDTHFGHIGHPSVVVFPAVIAARPANWQKMIEAALIGIEASIRVGLYLGRDHYQRGWHQTATAGAFGATLGAARVMKLTPTQIRHAFGLCASMASGLKAQFGSMGKPLNAGLAARAGVEAATWAGSGMTGADDGIDVFAQAMGADKDMTALDGIGDVWHIETLSHKFHACCHGLHATLEALSQYTGNSTVNSVQIETHPRWMSVCNQAAPDTGLGVKFSYAHVTAMALSGLSTSDIAMFSDAVAQDVSLCNLRSKITVRAADDLSEMQARVTVNTDNGPQVLTHDLAAPLAINVLGQKLRNKTDGLVGVQRSDALWAARGTGDLAAFQTAAFNA